MTNCETYFLEMKDGGRVSIIRLCYVGTISGGVEHGNDPRLTVIGFFSEFFAFGAACSAVHAIEDDTKFVHSLLLSCLYLDPALVSNINFSRHTKVNALLTLQELIAAWSLHHPICDTSNKVQQHVDHI